MYGDTDRGGATTALRFVTCDLSSLTDCGCVSSVDTDLSGSSSKRKYRSKPSPLIDPDSLTPLTAKRLILERPSLIDRLIYQNKSALEEMEGKKRGPKRTIAVKSKLDEKELSKRKRTNSMNGTSPAIKRLRNTKGGSDSESSESRNTSTERKSRQPSEDKGGNKKTTPKKNLRKTGKSRFSKRIVFSTSSLRSGKKRKEFMKRKRSVKCLTRDSKEKKKWVGGNDKTDSNSNVCTENDSNDEGVDDSTDSEISRGPLEPSELIEVKDVQAQTQDVKKRRKRRKRDSMWVKKVKKQIKAKAENTEIIPPPPFLAAEVPVCKEEEKGEDYESSDALEESDIPVLNKESDDSLILDSFKENVILNSVVPDDVAMPTLEKQVELEAQVKKCQNEINVQETEKNFVLDVKEPMESHKEPLETPEEPMKSSNEPLDSPSDPTENENPKEPYIPQIPSIPKTSIESNEVYSEQLNVEAIGQDHSYSCKLSLNPDKNNQQDGQTLEGESLSCIDSAVGKSEEITENISGNLCDNSETVNDHSEKCNSVIDNIDSEDKGESKPIVLNCNNVQYLPGAKVEESSDAEEEVDTVPYTLKEEVLEPEPNMFEDEDESEENYQEKETREDETEISKQHESAYAEEQQVEFFNKTEALDETQCKLSDITLDSSVDTKDTSLLDPDSTSDIKPQSLDDSFTDFSLSLPDDLELESSPSDEERGEESEGILPDSTESGQPEESSTEVHDPPQEDSPIKDKCSDNIPAIETVRENHTEDRKDEISQDLKTIEPSKLVVSDKLSSKKDISLSVSDPCYEILEKDLKPPETKSEELTVEQRQMKESVLQALGLKSLSAQSSLSTHQQPEEKPKRDGYTGTLKAVIKLNRSGDKKRMVYQRTEDSLGELEYRICSEIPSTDGVPITHLNDISGIRRNVAKLHQESDVNHGATTSNGVCEEHDDAKCLSGAKESNLIIPEKSSSFSIHPGRLCSDVCSYCFGKFGSLDTPCHVAQLKAERQKKILENELHLTGESCLCDACYRYVDRKANCPTKASGNTNRTRVKPPASSQCCVNLCTQEATHTVKKKWLVKLKKSITNKLDIDLDKPGSMYFPFCPQHHYWVDYFTVCGICRKRLNRNHLFSLGSETDRLNLMLAEDGIPARLSDKLFLCKLCRYYSNLRLKYSDPGSIPSSGQIFYRDYRRKILLSLDIPVSDSEDEHPVKEDKKKPSSSKKSMLDSNGSSNGAAPSNKSSDESVMSLSNLATLLGEQPEQQARIQVKFGNVNIGRLSNLNIGQGGRDREERLPYSDVGLQANLEFQGPAVPDGSWERCVSTIQFDKRTKKLWQDLQKPYGNQSSFLRHLVMLEKYWRAGYLTLAQGSDERAAKYLNGVKNRIKAFEGSSDKPPTTQNVIPVSSAEKFPLITNTGEIEVTPIKTTQKKPSVPPLTSEKKHMTHLDRAKSLVRMVPPAQAFPIPIQRYSMPMYVSPYGYPPQHRPPPLLKIRNKTSPHQYYHQIPQSMQNASVLKPILPKLPKALTVTQVPQGGPAITLNRSGITIEKQSGSPVPPSLPIEKPSISVFREPAPGPS